MRGLAGLSLSALQGNSRKAGLSGLSVPGRLVAMEQQQGLLLLEPRELHFRGVRLHQVGSRPLRSPVAL